MFNQKVSSGTVHPMPADLKKVLLKDANMRERWEDITPLARNEFICWIVSAKKSETRDHRIEVARDKLAKGERRPCCWAGCIHRPDKKPFLRTTTK